MFRLTALFALALATGTGTAAAAPDTVAPAPAPVIVSVSAAPAVGATHSGRLLVFVQKVDPADKPSDTVDTSPFRPTATSVIAREVKDLKPGHPALLGGETDAFPGPLSDLPKGRYRLQAVLDRNHDYNYGGRGPGDLVSPVIETNLPGAIPKLVLDHEIKATTDDALLARLPADQRQAFSAALAQVRPVDIASAKLTAFWGTPTAIRGWVALPPGYDKGADRYPTVYSDGGFGSSLASARFSAAKITRMMAKGDLPPMIWVFLDHHLASGTHEFADSVNNGPWGTALVTEAIPALEKQYRMDAKASGRFLTGHSSGGWSTLWLQVSHPKTFGGTWPTSPDPSDFHDFTNIDLYAPNANAYRDADGKPYPLVRDHGKLIATLEQFGKLEAVLGSYGGQFASFDWVFSPKCPDGRPCPLFNRATGDIDPVVAAYWRDHYDIAHIVKRDWATLKPDLDGKIHLIVGTADTFYLDGAARRFKAVLDKLGAKSDFRFLPDKTHFDLFEANGDRDALMKTIAKEMYAVARPAKKSSLDIKIPGA